MAFCINPPSWAPAAGASGLCPIADIYAAIFSYTVLTIPGQKGLSNNFSWTILLNLPKASCVSFDSMYLTLYCCQYNMIARKCDHPMNHTAIK